MSGEQIEQMCMIHQQKGVVVNLGSTTTEQKYFCEKCLNDKVFSKFSLSWVREAETLLKEMKSNQYQQEKNKVQSRLTKFKTLSELVQNYSEFVKNGFDKLIKQIDQRVKEIQQQFQELNEPSDLKIQEQEIKQLSSFYKGEYIFDNQKDKQDYEKDIKSKDKIKEELQYLSQNEQLKSIYKQLKVIENSKYDQESNVSKFNINLAQESDKTLALPFKCNKHEKEIVLLNLEENQVDQRLLCLECLPETQSKLTTLTQANKLWMQHQGEEFNKKHYFLSLRKEKFMLTKEIIKKFKQNYMKLEKELDEKLNKQADDVQESLYQLRQNQSRKELMQQDYDSVQQIAKLLSQKDKMIQIKKDHEKKDQEDQKYFNQIINLFKQFELIEVDSLSSLNLIFQINQSSIIGPENCEGIQFASNMELLRSQFENEKFDTKLFSYVIPKLQAEYQGLSQFYTYIVQQGQSFLDELQKDQQQKQEYQTQILIEQFQESLLKLKKQYNVAINQNNPKDEQLQTEIKQFQDQEPQTEIKQFNNQELQTEVQQSETVSITPQIQQLEESCIQSVSTATTSEVIKEKNNSFKFSNEFKHAGINLDETCKIAKFTQPNSVCLLDQPVLVNGTMEVDFQIKTQDQIYVGICKKSVVSGQSFVNNGSIDVGSGFYSLQSQGTIQADTVGSQKTGNPFTFTMDEKINIIIDYNTQNVKWTNKSKNDTFYAQDIQVSDDLFIFVGSGSGTGEIQII